MNIFKKVTLSLIFVSILFTSCEEEGSSQVDNNNSSISCTYSGEDVIIWPLALLTGDRRVGKPIEFRDRGGWVNYDCHAINYWNFGDGTTGTTTGSGGGELNTPTVQKELILLL